MSDTEEVVKLSEEETVAVMDLRQWLKDEADFTCRIDEQFLLMFLRSCEFNQRMTMKTLKKYHQNKVDYPQWFSNWSFSDPKTLAILRQRVSTLLSKAQPQQPYILMMTASKIEISDVTLDDHMKVLAMVFDLNIQFETFMLDDFIWIFDVKNVSTSVIFGFFNPVFSKHFLDCFIYGSPYKVSQVHVINAPAFVVFAFKTFLQPFLTANIKEKVFIHGSNVESLHAHVPKEWLPQELGGFAGPLSKHLETFQNDLQRVFEVHLNLDKEHTISVFGN